MTDILFVCTGNTCRSPMAAGLFNDYCENSGRNFKAISRGISVFAPSPASQNAIKAMAEMGIDINNHTSAQLTIADIKEAKLILAMTRSHKKHILDLSEEVEKKVFTLCEYVTGENGDIMDPFGSSLPDYLKCARQLRELIEKIKVD